MKLFVMTLAVSFGVQAAFAQSSTVSAPAVPVVAQQAVSDTSSITAPAAAVVSKPSKWTGMAYLGMYNDVSKFHRDNGDDGAMADAFLQVRRDIGNGHKMALRVNGMYNQTDGQKTDEWALYDTQILYSFPTFASNFRLSIPTSEWGQEIGRHELRYNGGYDVVKAGKFTLSGIVEARGFAYTKEEDGQRLFRGNLGAWATYAVAPTFEPFFGVRHEYNRYYHGVGLNIEGNPVKDREERVEVTYIDLGASIDIIPKKFNLYAYIEQARARNSDAGLNLFDEDQSAYNFEFSIFM